LMSVTAIALPASCALPVARPHVCLGAVARRTAVSLSIGCVVPAVVFYALFVVGGVWMAILATLAWSYGALGWRALSGRRTSALLVLTTAVLTARTAVAVATDSPFVYFLQPIVTDALIAAVFLISLRTARPLAGKLLADFYPVDSELAVRPRVVRLFRGLTMMWAALWLAKGTLGLWLLLTQPLETYVPVKAALALGINLMVAVVTIAAAAYVARREGLVSK
jgi:uncharacterized membrane protein